MNFNNTCIQLSIFKVSFQHVINTKNYGNALHSFLTKSLKSSVCYIIAYFDEH